MGQFKRVASTPVAVAPAMSDPSPPTDSVLAKAYERVRLYAKRLEHAQEEISRQSNVLNSVLQSISDGVVVAGLDGHFLSFNPAAERILGKGLMHMEIDQWSGRYGCFLPDAVTPYPPHQLPLARAIQGETVYDGEIFIRNAERPRGLYISVNASPLRDAAGAVIGGVAAFRDITQHKRMDEALRAGAAELARSNEDLQRFAFVVSHDLQKPLRQVSGFCRLLGKRRAGDADTNKLLDLIVASAGRMEKLVQNLLTYARVGRGGVRFTQVDLNAVFRQALGDLGTGPDSPAAVELAPLPKVNGDATQLEQLALNLLDNALKYQAGGTPLVRVTAEHQGTDWLLAVRDNGIGIEPQALQRIFQAFERAQSDTAYPGTGLGLAICKRIVENHGGRIWVESQPGAGTTFFFTLPC